MLDRLSGRRFASLLAGLVLLVMALVGATQKFPVPHDDSLEYLGYARTLYVTGRFAATPAGPAQDAAPGREPLYSAFVLQ